MILRSVQWHGARAPWGDTNPAGQTKDVPAETGDGRGMMKNDGDPQIPPPIPRPGGGWIRWGSWGVSRSCRRVIARPGSVALSPLGLEVPPCLAAPSVGVVCPLLTHTFSEHTASFILQPPPRRRFLAAIGPSPPLSPLLPSPPLWTRCLLQNAARLLHQVAPLHPRVPMPRGCHPSLGLPGTWPRGTSFPPSPALGC